jgi:hypothetical protein
MDFLGSLDVLSIRFGNENDLHGLMKLSAFSPFCQRGWVVGCIVWLLGASSGPIQPRLIMIDE